MHGNKKTNLQPAAKFSSNNLSVGNVTQRRFVRGVKIDASSIASINLSQCLTLKLIYVHVHFSINYSYNKKQFANSREVGEIILREHILKMQNFDFQSTKLMWDKRNECNKLTKLSFTCKVNSLAIPQP